MNDPKPRSAVYRLIDGVLALIDTERDDPHYIDKAQSVLSRCSVVLNATPLARQVAGAHPTPPVAAKIQRASLAVRIAELRANGMGVREIARQLGVNPSTVSRRLHRAQHIPHVASATGEADTNV
jgi:DNA-binding NarL/FixJ family response regulator